MTISGFALSAISFQPSGKTMKEQIIELIVPAEAGMADRPIRRSLISGWTPIGFFRGNASYVHLFKKHMATRLNLFCLVCV